MSKIEMYRSAAYRNFRVFRCPLFLISGGLVLNNAKKPISGKGFYAVLFASVAMIGAAGFFAYNQTAKELGSQLSSIGNSVPDDLNVGAPVTDVPKQTTTQRTTTTTTEQTTMQTEGTTTPSTSAPQAKARSFVMPAAGKIILPFSDGELIKSPTTGAWQTHNGIDIAAGEGDDVLAMASGTVISVENDALWGIVITIDHGDDLVARYANLEPDVNVAAGDKVSAGKVIGTVGRSADIESLQESHLHFEVLSDGEYVNPVNVIDAHSN